jgi:hypothetical protein
MRKMQCNRMLTALSGLIIGMALIWAAGPAAGCEKEDVDVDHVRPIMVIRDGEARAVRLSDVHDHYGNTCLSATTAFLATSYGIELLFGADPADLNDLMVFTPSAGGSIDFLDLLMRPDPGQRTWPPAAISGNEDSFVFHFYRKSTMQGVVVRLQDGLWPANWNEMREKQKAGTITEAERKQRQQDRRAVLEGFPAMDFTELFGEPMVFTYVTWGHLQPGEMDRLLRDQRCASRGQGE